MATFNIKIDKKRRYIPGMMLTSTIDSFWSWEPLGFNSLEEAKKSIKEYKKFLLKNKENKEIKEEIIYSQKMTKTYYSCIIDGNGRSLIEL